MKKQIITFFAAISLGQPGFTQTAPAGVQSDLAPPPAPTTTLPASDTPSQNVAATTGRSQNNSSGAIAQAIGTALIAAGTAMMASCSTTCSCCPAAMQMIMMGMMGLAQAGNNRSTAGNHGVNALQNVSSNQDPYGMGINTTSGLSTSGFNSVEDKVLKDLAKYGITKKDGKYVLPNGKSVSLNDALNQQAMANAGVSPEDWKKAMKLASDLEKKETEKIGAATAENGYESGGGGRGGASSSTAEEILVGGGGPSGPARDPAASVAGMTKNYNGDTIGVAGDDLFQMMARRYKAKSDQDSFLPPEAAPSGPLKPIGVPEAPGASAFRSY